MILSLLWAGGIVWADNPQFQDPRTTVSIDADGRLVISFKETGLGNNEEITYMFLADVTAVFNCVTKSGNCPNAANKTTVEGPLSKEATFTSKKNGTVSGTIILNPRELEPEALPKCGKGQSLKVISVDYETVSLTDMTNNYPEGVAATLPDAGPFRGHSLTAPAPSLIQGGGLLAELA